MNKDFWMAKNPGGLDDGGEMAYDNSSRVEPKRSQQWLMDGTEAELFPNKKQAVEDPNHTSFSGLLNSTNISPWGNALSFTERLFDPENVRSNDFNTRNNASVGIGSMNLGIEVIEDPFVSNSTFGLPVSNLLEDPRSVLNYGGIRKVKVSQVKDSENFMSVSVGPDYVGGYNNTMSTSRAYKEAGDTSVTMGLSFNNGDENVISMRDNFKVADSNFISMGQSYDKGDNSHISIGQTYEENNTAILMGHSLIKDESNSVKMRETFTEGDKDTISMSHTFKDSNHILPVGQLFSKDDSNITSMGQIFNKMDNSGPSMGLSLNNGESTIISFGGLNDDDNANPSGRLECSYDLLTGQSLLQSSEARSGKGLRDSNADTISHATQLTNRGDPLSKKTEEQKANKKGPQNNFPSNVRSLLSTGMLDGVPVKYVVWSQEKELRGIIQGSGYLCGCQLCNLSKAINAYEFERHAGCKTKHPNNHIYFENGKTIYGIVQELRNTPQNLLFEVIQTITGSPINQKSFRLWKESFLAATRELQRIYGKEEGKHFS